MRELTNFYINGSWITPQDRQTLPVINPATEKSFATISLGTAQDVDMAAQAARTAFDDYATTSREESERENHEHGQCPSQGDVAHS